jgi:pimeloyl-ACP methyl ester carboxylesterase
MNTAGNPLAEISSPRSNGASLVAICGLLSGLVASEGVMAARAIPVASSKLPAAPVKTITAADVTAEKVGSSVPASAIGLPVGSVTLNPPRWVEDANGGYGVVDGQILPVDPKGKAINFRVGLPAKWARRGLQLGGGGMNGTIPGVTSANDLAQGFATYGSDSGHQGGGFGGGGNDWALNDEAVRNFGYMQMKKTHDVAMVIMERVYGERPRFNYYIGSSQGGREALTVAQRYPADYDGIIADVPILNFSSLTLAPELIRIQEKPAANWVPTAKTAAIREEFIRQGDKLDGLEDGVINNYMAARALFDMSQGNSKRNPWAALRGPDGKDPNPADTSTTAKLSDGQIETLKFIYTPYKFATPLANGVKTFGMWVPNTDPSGSGLLVNARYKGQEGASPDAQAHSQLGIAAVTGALMQDLSANPLDYVEGGKLNKRREEISGWLDSTNPDLSAFYKRGGKMIVTIGTNDTLASPGAQLDYYQSVIKKMGRGTVDAFARLFVLPQTGHGLSGSSHTTNGAGKEVARFQIPNQYDKRGALIAWVEQNQAPEKTLLVKAGTRSLPLCSYPTYPKYISGPVETAESYRCAAP